MIFDTHYPRLFGIPDTHSLVLDDDRESSKGRTQKRTRWFIEQDEQARTVARYRTWTTIGLDAPFKRQLGWERYSTSGALLVREVRYARGAEQPDSPDSARWLN